MTQVVPEESVPLIITSSAIKTAEFHPTETFHDASMHTWRNDIYWQDRSSSSIGKVGEI